MRPRSGTHGSAEEPDTKQKPLFLFSLPRSGSTLVQRVLSAREEIATVSEPWLLLPYLYTLRDRGVYAEYNHTSVVTAIQDFCKALPYGEEDYVAAVREFVLGLYGKASPGEARYFLDKTPRYHLISDEIINMFPGGKFVFLWRNPLAVAASMMETWADGKWNLYRHKVDLFDGIEALTRAYERHGDSVCSVRYEDLIENSGETWDKVFGYLELPLDNSALEGFSGVKLGGRKGDPSGILKYDRFSREPLSRWKQSLNNPFRKAWCRRYLRWIGQERLAMMGYDMRELLDELDALPASYKRMGSDVGRGCYGILHDLVEPKISKRKLRLLPAWNRIHVHR